MQKQLLGVKRPKRQKPRYSITEIMERMKDLGSPFSMQ